MRKRVCYENGRTGADQKTTLREEKYREALSYRQPRQVQEILKTAVGDCFPICPRCNCSLEREFMSYCDRCGQKLCWNGYPAKASVRIAGAEYTKEKQQASKTPV